MAKDNRAISVLAVLSVEAVLDAVDEGRRCVRPEEKTGKRVAAHAATPPRPRQPHATSLNLGTQMCEVQHYISRKRCGKG